MFQGYNDETFEFFMAIRFNNNTDFFHSNRDWYLRGVREPSLALAEALGPTVEWLDDSLERRPNRVVSRINRDIRFSNDKSPYRDYLWLSFHRPKEERADSIGLYFDLSVSGGSCGMGFYKGSKPLMNALRRRILTEPETLSALVEPVLREFTLVTNSYRRMAIPDSVPEILRPLYPVKGYYFEKPLDDFSLLKSPDLAEEIARSYRLLAPLYHYLQALTPVEDGDVTVDRPQITL